MSITSSGDETTNALSGKLSFEQGKNRIIGRDENNLPRLLILANGDEFVMKVSKSGMDVLLADNNNLVFNSANNLFKILKTNTAAFPATGSASIGGVTTQTIDIDTGVVSTTPLIALCFFYSTGSQPQLIPFAESMSSAGAHYGGYVAFNCTATPYVNLSDNDEIHITVRMQNYTGSILGAATIRWYLLQETAA
jgi:hypothetical protein